MTTHLLVWHFLDETTTAYAQSGQYYTIVKYEGIGCSDAMQYRNNKKIYICVC